jgi:hypothetical protein
MRYPVLEVPEAQVPWWPSRNLKTIEWQLYESRVVEAYYERSKHREVAA